MGKKLLQQKPQSYEFLNVCIKTNVTIFNTEIYPTYIVQSFNSEINYFQRKKQKQQ